MFACRGLQPKKCFSKRLVASRNGRAYHSVRDHLSEEELGQLQRITRLPVVHHEGYVCPLPPKHRFQMMKFHHLYKILIKDGVIDQQKQVIEPKQVSREVAGTVHSRTYVNKFFDGSTSEQEQRVTGFKWTPGLASRVRYETGTFWLDFFDIGFDPAFDITGGTLLAGKICLDRGLACSTGGGTHHAFPDYGSGYCLINDLAVTAYRLIESGLVTKVMIVDLDVHQGDGTAFIFQNRPDIFTLSLHCQNNFPLRKQESDLDVGLDVGLGDTGYMRILSEYLPATIDKFHPDVILYDAGVDPHEKDQLGKLKLTDQGLYNRDMFVLKTAICRGIPVMTVIGGGYDEILALSARHSIIHRVATEVWNSYL